MKIQGIQGIIDAAAAKTTAKLGVFFENLATGETAGINVDEIFPTASVYKIFTLAELLLLAKKGRFSLDDRRPLDMTFKSDSIG